LWSPKQIFGRGGVEESLAGSLWRLLVPGEHRCDGHLPDDVKLPRPPPHSSPLSCCFKVGRNSYFLFQEASVEPRLWMLRMSLPAPQRQRPGVTTVCDTAGSGDGPESRREMPEHGRSPQQRLQKTGRFSASPAACAAASSRRKLVAAPGKNVSRLRAVPAHLPALTDPGSHSLPPALQVVNPVGRAIR
jgi:hypothetical protein